MRDPENIREIAHLPVDYLGFIFYPRSKRFVGDAQLSIPGLINSEVKKVGVFVNAELDYILEMKEKHRLDLIQLHGDETQNYTVKLAS